MKTYTHTLDGSTVTIYLPEVPGDLYGFDAFLRRGDKVLGVDSETTGLDIYSPGHELRTVQFGNETEAWVLRTDLFANAARRALTQNRRFTFHNASYDLQVIDRHLGVPIEELGPKSFDSRIFAHLIDPRQRHEGGAGLSLKELSEVYIDPDASDGQKELHEVFRKDYKAKVSEGWRVIDVDHPVYVRYAGLDPILAVRLFRALAPMIRDLGMDNLSQFEHHFQTLLAIMQRRGVRVDVPYTEGLKADLHEEAEKYRKVAAKYGVENVNSTQQVAAALDGMGETLHERTPSGGVKVDKGVLLPLADLDQQWERIEARKPNPLADAVLRSKRAEKWAETYAGSFLDLRDSDDRLHPFIGGLQARTARMSISRPPLQQLPSSDYRIRRALVADPGNVFASIDYKAVELRVLTGLADVSAMRDVFTNGEDPHDATARLIFGEDFTKGDRKIAKAANFLTVYGGGPTALAKNAGITVERAKEVLNAFNAAYPEIRRFGKMLSRKAEFGKREVVTVVGRHLPLDRDRLYAGVNFVTQSTARDLLAQAVVDVFDAGLGEHLTLPIHDELLVEVPNTREGEAIVAEIAHLMESTFIGVRIESDPEIGRRSWGSLYGAHE